MNIPAGSRAILLFLALSNLESAHAGSDLRFLQVEAHTKEQRTAIETAGMSIEAVRTGSVWGFADSETLARLRGSPHRILGDFPASIGRGGHEGILDFPPGDSRYHDAAELLARLKDLRQNHADVSSIVSIGKTVEGRDIWAFHLNTSPEAHSSAKSSKPGAVFMGNHHAREHLSLEVPLMLLEYLLANRDNPEIARLIDARDLWFIPQVNPDGAEYDIAAGKYRGWRKNRRKNAGGTIGVDLNRNYGYQWGTGGSSASGSSDVYMGEKAFSEPETRAIRDFVDARPNTKVLLTFHTFSELILYPWGHKYDGVDNARDRAVFEKMAKTMAGWNGYTPEQASELYIASGDTTDWAYGEHGIFAFTFELSPRDAWGIDGFYPGPGAIDKVFADNLKPCLYLIDAADNPYKVIDSEMDAFDFWRITPDLSTIGAR